MSPPHNGIDLTSLYEGARFPPLSRVRSGFSPARFGQATISLVEIDNSKPTRPGVFWARGTQAHFPKSSRKSVIEPDLQTVFGFFNAPYTF